MVRKLKSRHGSTLIEVLCAFLVIALSTSLFAVAVGAANHINVKASENWRAFHNQISAVEARSNEGDDKQLKILDANAPLSAPIEYAVVDIQLYQGDDSGGLFYYVPK